jgi:palmitoyltransferase
MEKYFDPCGKAVDHTDLHLWCQLCNCYVNETSKHCGACNRCSYEFDHHCNWLNTCVAHNNYWNFYRLVWAYLSFVVYFVGVAAYGLIEGTLYANNQAIFWTICGEILVSLVGFVALVDLIQTHQWL